ncbi:hypothetical protein DVA67_023230 [Solirubrobacter sp. CPCC 204708]|uniref:Uncharacterized protein n=1 Tax=Solirubrobacter deserti TaxID=2282478 RepID=A0ABT4RV00_9ACTN|nr:hypothetical protein [Solirubrobacter deserti]MBE2318905.1 hypothetical protein [Solirubrobacter deserti]MDA0142409.1 hypothetical protein [Solirubrobacter deserti]
MPSHGTAAFARADLEDARRGRPAFSLAPHAAAHGLQWLDRQAAAGFAAAIPSFPEYRFNIARGVLPGGRHGVVFHQLLEVPVTKWPNISGKLHGTKVKLGGGRWWLPNRTDIPFIGAFLDLPTDDRPPAAFDSHAVWIPTTTVAINVPETALPYFLTRIDRRDKHAPFDFPHRQALANGWRLRAHGPVPDPRIDAVLARHADDPYFAVHVLRGTVIVRRNGFLADPDALARDACAIADALALAAPPAPRPFADPLPAPHSHHPEVTPGWSDGYARLAHRLGLQLEDADDYQRAFPTLGVPGRAVAVMRGELAPGVHGRLVYSAEHNLRVAERARGAVLLPASGPPTPPGGERLPDRHLVYEQRDGVAVLWSLRTAGFYREEQEDLIARAVLVARERGVVAA